MRKRRSMIAALILVVVVGCITGCGVNGSAGLTADLQTFAGDFMRQVLAAFLL